MSDIDTALNILENYGNVETIECSEFEELNQFFCENSNGLHFTVLHYNIRSLQAHFDEVCISISELNKYNNIAIIIFSETWNLKNIDCYNIKGFQIYYNEARYNKCDGVVMEHEYNNLRYINMMQQNGYVSQINLPTRVEANSSTTIDHIFMKINKPKVSDSNNVNCTPFLLKNCITDHYPVLLNFSYLKKNNLLTYNNSIGHPMCVLNWTPRQVDEGCEEGETVAGEATSASCVDGCGGLQEQSLTYWLPQAATGYRHWPHNPIDA
nr:unnamed protein product [Callosobruchus analis]